MTPLSAVIPTDALLHNQPVAHGENEFCFCPYVFEGVLASNS